MNKREKRLILIMMFSLFAMTVINSYMIWHLQVDQKILSHTVRQLTFQALRVDNIDDAVGLRYAFERDGKTDYETCRETCIYVYHGNRKRMKKCFTLCCNRYEYDCRNFGEERNGL